MLSSNLREKPVYFRYGISVLAVAVAVPLRFAVESHVSWETPWAFFALAILISARFGGFGPGALATGLSTFAGLWFFNDRHFPRTPGGMLNTAVLDAAGLSISFLCGQLRGALEKSLEQQRRCESIIAAAPGVIFRFAIGTDGQVAMPFASSALHEIYGIEPAEVKWDAAALFDRIHPDDRAGVATCIAESKEKMSLFRKEYRVLNPDKGELWVESRSVPVKEMDGSYSWYGFAIDITARMRLQLEALRHGQEIEALNATLEQRVRERTAQLEAANGELEAFSYSVSHDLRAPLRGIGGWIRALEEEYGKSLDERALNFIGRIRYEAQRMGRLIEDLIELSRVTRAEMQPQEVDVSELAARLAGALGESRRNVEFGIEPGLRAFGDPRLLEIALGNLLENAVKFTAPQPHPRIAVVSAERNGRPGICVRDNGVGFDPRHSGMLFGPFQRLHKESEFPGTGIGLATVKRIIHRHGGEVWAEGEAGAGATFGFTTGVSQTGFQLGELDQLTERV